MQNTDLNLWFLEAGNVLEADPGTLPVHGVDQREVSLE